MTAAATRTERGRRADMAPAWPTGRPRARQPDSALTCRSRSRHRVGSGVWCRRVHPMPGSLLGNVVRRIEDPELLTGEGTFVGNLRVDGCCTPPSSARPSPTPRSCRSTPPTRARAARRGRRAHGRRSRRRAVPPVRRPERSRAPAAARLGSGPLRRRPGRRGVAETAAARRDAVDLVDVDYESLPSVVDMEAALRTGRPARVRRGGREPDRRVP